MIKEEYNKISDKLNLPRRCPLVGRCERYLYTVYFLNYDYEIEVEELIKELGISREKAILDILVKKRKLYEKDRDSMVNTYGSEPERSIGGHETNEFPTKKRVKEDTEGSSNSWSFSYKNICPEVTLFENFSKRQYVPAEGLNFVSYYRNYYFDEEIERKNSCHFSECAEFSKFQFENNSNKNLKQKNTDSRRTAISKVLRFEIFQRDKHTCRYCGRTVKDGVKLVIDHKIPVKEGGKTEFGNLITSCEECNQGKSDKVI